MCETLKFLLVCFRTKKIIVDVIRIQPGESLSEILDTPATAPQVNSSHSCRTRLLQRSSVSQKFASCTAGVGAREGGGAAGRSGRSDAGGLEEQPGGAGGQPVASGAEEEENPEKPAEPGAGWPGQRREQIPGHHQRHLKGERAPPRWQT